MTDITPPPPHLLKKFSEQAREDSKKRGHPGYCKTFAILCIEWAMNSQSTPNDCQIRSSDITPPPELVQQWLDALFEEGGLGIDPHKLSMGLTTRAAQWGADQELEACCKQVAEWQEHWECKDERLRAARRPNPPSLKEQALAAVESGLMTDERLKTIRRALEALDD